MAAVQNGRLTQFVEIGSEDSEDDLSPEWEVRATDDGKLFYANHVTKTTQWEHPISGKRRKITGNLPYGWTKQYDSKGNVFFVDSVSDITTYVDPRLALASSSSCPGDQQRKFGSSTTALQVLKGQDLSGRVVIITGANSGIGYETARALALHGAHIIMGCRDLGKANRAAARIRKEQNPEPRVTTMHLDLTSFRSIRGFAAEFKELNLPLHILICNAAVFGIPWQDTEDGIECTFAINHLGHFYLVKLLQDVLCSSAPARVVVVSSESHRFTDSSYSGSLPITSLPLSKDNYVSILAYNQSKLCNMLFSMELNRRLQSFGVTSNAVHPGNLIYTSLAKQSWVYWVLFLLARPFSKSVAQGAATTVFCATSEELDGVGGLYFNNCQMCEPSAEANNMEVAAALWQLSERLLLQAKISSHSVIDL